MIRNAYRAAALTTLIASAALAQTKAPSQPAAAPKETPPAPAPAKNFRVPPHRSITLSNGMQVTFIPFGIVPKVTVELTLRTGVIDEGANDVTLASVVGDMLLEGTTTKSSLDISRQAAEMGGVIN